MELGTISNAALSSNRTEWKHRIGIKNNGIRVEVGDGKIILCPHAPM
jgi:hypothetical protein